MNAWKLHVGLVLETADLSCAWEGLVLDVDVATVHAGYLGTGHLNVRLILKTSDLRGTRECLVLQIDVLHGQVATTHFGQLTVGAWDLSTLNAGQLHVGLVLKATDLSGTREGLVLQVETWLLRLADWKLPGWQFSTLNARQLHVGLVLEASDLSGAWEGLILQVDVATVHSGYLSISSWQFSTLNSGQLDVRLVLEAANLSQSRKGLVLYIESRLLRLTDWKLTSWKASVLELADLTDTGQGLILVVATSENGCLKVAALDCGRLDVGLILKATDLSEVATTLGCRTAQGDKSE